MSYQVKLIAIGLLLFTLLRVTPAVDSNDDVIERLWRESELEVDLQASSIKDQALLRSEVVPGHGRILVTPE